MPFRKSFDKVSIRSQDLFHQSEDDPWQTRQNFELMIFSYAKLSQIRLFLYNEKIAKDRKTIIWYNVK